MIEIRVGQIRVGQIWEDEHGTRRLVFHINHSGAILLKECNTGAWSLHNRHGIVFHKLIEETDND